MEMYGHTYAVTELGISTVKQMVNVSYNDDKSTVELLLLIAIGRVSIRENGFEHKHVDYSSIVSFVADSLKLLEQPKIKGRTFEYDLGEDPAMIRRMQVKMPDLLQSLIDKKLVEKSYSGRAIEFSQSGYGTPVPSIFFEEAGALMNNNTDFILNTSSRGCWDDCEPKLEWEHKPMPSPPLQTAWKNIDTSTHDELEAFVEFHNQRQASSPRSFHFSETAPNMDLTGLECWDTYQDYKKLKRRTVDKVKTFTLTYNKTCAVGETDSPMPFSMATVQPFYAPVPNSCRGEPLSQVQSTTSSIPVKKKDRVINDITIVEPFVATETKEETCVICEEWSASILFFPCRHKILCSTCALKIVEGGDKVCPMCLVKPTMIMSVFENTDNMKPTPITSAPANTEAQK